MGDNKLQGVFDKIQNFDYEATLRKIKGEITKPNILVCGGTGVGKSSLINYLFGANVAEVGSSVPVTDKITRYADDNSSVVLFDTIGYEIGEEKQQEFYKEVISFVKEQNSAAATAEQIHLVWYCISAANKRVTPMDLTALATLGGLAKTCVAFTQVDSATKSEIDEMKQVIAERLPEAPIFLVSTDERIPKERLGWEALINWSLDNLDSGLKLAFAQALGKELEVKRLQAEGLIKKYVVAAAGAVASPLPMTDSAALIAIQTTMATHIFSYWGIDKASDKIKEIFINVVISNMGRTVSKTLLKLIPGVGTVASLVVNGGVATSFTYAFGKAVNEICYHIAQRVAQGEKVDIEAALSLDVVMSLIEKYYKKK